jgi:hypothetical protein
MDDTMAVLLKAAIGSPMATPSPAAAVASTPSQAAAVASDEFAEFFVPVGASSRLSLQPPRNCQTPGSPPAASANAASAIASLPTVGPLPMPPAALTPIRMSPAPPSAEALTMATATAEAAELRAIIKDKEHAAVIAAERAENKQLRSDLAHMNAMLAQRTK